MTQKTIIKVLTKLTIKTLTGFCFMLLGHFAYSQSDTIVKKLATNRRHSCQIKIFQDSLYLIKTDNKSLNKAIKRTNNSVLTKAYNEMTQKNHTDFYLECKKINMENSLLEVTANLMESGHCITMSREPIEKEEQVILKKFIIPVKNERQRNRQFYVKKHLLLQQKHLLY